MSEERKLSPRTEAGATSLPTPYTEPASVWFWEGTLDTPAGQHRTLTIWFLTVFLNDLVDLLVQVFVFGGYLKGESREETWFENTAV